VQLSTNLFSAIRASARAGNGTRTRDPNLGKVVLYQLSYSRETAASGGEEIGGSVLDALDSVSRPWEVRDDGGEGNRTPDLLNAIQALSQLSYAPHLLECHGPNRGNRPEPRSIAEGIASVNEIRPSENLCGQYFAAPSRDVAASRMHSRIPVIQLLIAEMRRVAVSTSVAAHKCRPPTRPWREDQ
jgi:hypothetical protein